MKPRHTYLLPVINEVRAVLQPVFDAVANEAGDTKTLAQLQHLTVVKVLAASSSGIAPVCAYGVAYRQTKLFLCYC